MSFIEHAKTEKDIVASLNNPDSSRSLNVASKTILRTEENSLNSLFTNGTYSTLPFTVIKSSTMTSTSTTVITQINKTFSSYGNLIVQSSGTVYPIIYGSYIPQPNIRVSRENKKPIKKFVKNSIKRALRLLDNFNMEEDSKIFLKGEEVEISHPDSMFKFVLTKRSHDNIILLTQYPGKSIPFRLELFTKTNIHIANLCVYAEDTPMLDQLFMIAMYVKTGNEEELLRKSNFSKITSDTKVKENIISKLDYLDSKLCGPSEYHRYMDITI